MAAEGEHDWIAMVVYRIDDKQARAMHEGPPTPPVPVIAGDEEAEWRAENDPRAFLRMEMIDQELSSVGCWKCEKPWTPRVAVSPCPGEPE